MDPYGRGYNPGQGFDSGPPPPPAGGFPGFGGQMGMGMGGVGGYGGFQPMPMPMYAPPPPYPQFGYGGGGFGFPGYGGYGQTHPSIPPFTDGGVPGINLRNATGGVGIPPGYNYLFPSEHTHIHVLKTQLPPWHLSVSNPNPFPPHSKLIVPTNVTVKELMKALGCNNEDPKKNVLHEVQECGGGKWVKGLTINGDNKDRCKKLVSEMGWDKSRTGMPGARAVVWVWCTNK